MAIISAVANGGGSADPALGGKAAVAAYMNLE
jgi:hypothetical protein